EAEFVDQIRREGVRLGQYERAAQRRVGIAAVLRNLSRRDRFAAKFDEASAGAVSIAKAVVEPDQAGVIRIARRDVGDVVDRIVRIRRVGQGPEVYDAL